MKQWTKETALAYVTMNEKNRGLTFQSAKDYLNNHTTVRVIVTVDGEVLISNR